MTATISTFALLMIILVIHTILEHLTNWVFRKLWSSYGNDSIPYIVLYVTSIRWVFTVSLIKDLLS
jgi:hypothetical protein